MTYQAFLPGKPDIIDAGGDIIDDIRWNFEALRDAIVAGRLVGWNLSVSGGTAEEPAQIVWASGVYRIRASITWADGNPTVLVYAFSGDSGSNYDAIGTLTISYDVDSNVTGTTWS